jgi:hypothetical protein
MPVDATWALHSCWRPGQSVVPLPGGGSDSDGTWFGGRLFSSRTRECSSESLDLLRKLELGEWQTPNVHSCYFALCNASDSPYDLAVQTCLVIRVHHLGNAIHVGDDGSLAARQEASALCREVFGYGSEFRLN